MSGISPTSPPGVSLILLVHIESTLDTSALHLFQLVQEDSDQHFVEHTILRRWNSEVFERSYKRFSEAYIDTVATYLFLCRSKRTVSANGDQIMHPFLSSKVLS